MQIPDLKSRLNILAVAEKLGIEVNKFGKALCPFHDDKRPSLQFSEAKQICTCFSGRCSAGTMDAIGLVEKKLKVGTHEAIKWLQQEFALGEQTPTKSGRAKASKETPTDEAAKYAKLFKIFEGNFKKSDKAQRYLQERNLDLKILEVGMNGTDWPQMKQCVIFPLRDKDDRIVSLYGRSILNNGGARAEGAGKH
jgi:DNA primase